MHCSLPLRKLKPGQEDSLTARCTTTHRELRPQHTAPREPPGQGEDAFPPRRKGSHGAEWASQGSGLWRGPWRMCSVLTSSGKVSQGRGQQDTARRAPGGGRLTWGAALRWGGAPTSPSPTQCLIVIAFELKLMSYCNMFHIKQGTLLYPSQCEDYFKKETDFKI